MATRVACSVITGCIIANRFDLHTIDLKALASY